MSRVVTILALTGAVLLLAAWLQHVAGDKGLYAVALASGVADLDAITLSSLRLFGQNRLDTAQVVMSISLAFLSNMVFKSGLVLAIGGGPLARRTLPGMAAIAVGVSAGLLIFLA